MYPSRHAPAPASNGHHIDLSTTDSHINELHRAAEAGDADIVQVLLECGVDINSEVPNGGTALHVAAREGHLDIVKLLLTHNADVDKLLEGRGTALHFAAEEGHLDVVRFLLDEGADIEARSIGGETALAKTIYEGQLEIVRLLLDHGAAQLVRAEDNLTALHEASMAEDTDIVRLLIAYGADLDAVDDEGRSALHFAAQCGETEIVRVLLESGAKVNINEGSSGPKPLSIAAGNGHVEVVRLLLNYGADVRAVRLDARFSVLHDAARMGESEIVELLLEWGADINVCARDGSTPLHHAATNGYKDTVALLLDLGAAVDTSASGSYSGTALHCTLRSFTGSNLEILRILLAHGADCEALDPDGLTPMQIARMRRDGGVAMLKLLRQHLGTLREPSLMMEQVNVPAAYSTSAEREELLNDNAQLCDKDDPADWKRAITLGAPAYVSQIITNVMRTSYSQPNQTYNLNRTLKRGEVATMINSAPLFFLDSNRIHNGFLWLVRYEHISHSPFDLESAMRIFRECMFSGGIGYDRFRAARLYADLCLQFRDATSAMRPFKLAMELLQEVVDPGQNMLMRYRLIPSVRDTVDAAVAAAIQNGDLVLALEWFEQGRCIIWGQLSRLRPPVEEIRDHSPKLAEDMEAIIKEMSALEALTERPIAHAGREGAMTRHQELSTQYEEMVLEAQNISGLGGYMKPKSMEELRGAARRSHVVALNVAWWRCDALILRHQSLDVIHVPLPQVSPEVLQRLFSDFQHALNSAEMHMRSAVPGQWDDEASLDPVLSELWTSVVEPVLVALGCTEMPSNAHPRVTWCASGLLAFLPLHAAGLYSEGPRERCSTALDLAVHSYIPSITSLLSAIRVNPPTEQGIPTIFAVSQPATPHQVPIPSTVTEVKAIQHVAGSGLTWLNDSAATSSAVLTQMEQHTWVHLACHAIQDPLEPLQSAFLLHDGSLTLRSIMRLRFDRGKALAVLSACQTATGDSTVPDEAVHLAAGMFMAGFQNMVGTMWSINDNDAPVFATAFYSYLISDAHGDSSRTAEALHYAVRKLRDQVGESSFFKWVPFIHVGI